MKNDFDLITAAKGWTGLKRGFCIEMDSACRNLQGTTDETEK